MVLVQFGSKFDSELWFNSEVSSNSESSIQNHLNYTHGNMRQISRTQVRPSQVDVQKSEEGLTVFETTRVTIGMGRVCVGSIRNHLNSEI
jgi:hypothetical protein